MQICLNDFASTFWQACNYIVTVICRGYNYYPQIICHVAVTITVTLCVPVLYNVNIKDVLWLKQKF